jgi:hypothetical protein
MPRWHSVLLLSHISVVLLQASVALLLTLAPAVLPLTLASVLLMVSLVSVVLLVSMVVIAVFRAILMVSEVTLQLTAPAIEEAMATVTMDAGDVMASTPTATGMAIPMKAATTPTATADTGAFWFAP